MGEVTDFPGNNGKDHRVPISEVLKQADEAGLTDIIVIGRRKDNDQTFVAVSTESGAITTVLLEHAKFHITHTLFG